MPSFACRLSWLPFVLAGCQDTASLPVDVVGDGDTQAAGDVLPEVDTALPDCEGALEGSVHCAPDGRLGVCQAGVWRYSDCSVGSRCEAAACVPIVCAQGEARCHDAITREVCSVSGTRFLAETCAGSCNDGVCVDACEPGVRRCDGDQVVECGADLTQTVVETCDEAGRQQCIDGRCVDECTARGGKRGYIACDFWAADLPNDRRALDNAFAFAFANDGGATATVRVSYPWGTERTVEVPPGGVARHFLPLPRTLTQLAGPGVARAGFRIRSDQPIAAFMFNPLERFDDPDDPVVTSADAALIVPATSLGTRYVAITASDYGVDSRPPFVAVIATHDDTEVVVTSTETVVSNAPSLTFRKGEPTTVVLDAFEVLNLETPSAAGVRRDLSGTRVESRVHPIAVFAGNRCARIPEQVGSCDHVEAQLPPIDTWGDRYVVTKLADRGGEPDKFKVIALDDFTELVFDPPRFSPVMLAGTVWEFDATEGFSLTANHPVLLGQFMVSPELATGPSPFPLDEICRHDGRLSPCLGDPAMVAPAPVAQWRDDLSFLVPDTYRYAFVNLAFDAATQLTLDGSPIDVSQAVPIGQGAWRSMTLPVAGGLRTLVASGPVGAIVYGYDDDVGYAYNAGMSFEPLGFTP